MTRRRSRALTLRKRDGFLMEEKLKDVGEGGVKGLVRVEHFKPEKTHDIGYSEKGEVMDMVSIWSHPGAV